MTARVQSLRSSTKGARPPAGRAVGELYTNFPDKQIGVVGPAGNIDLVPVRFFSETADYAVGDLIARGGSIYRAAVAITAGPWKANQWTDVINENDHHHGVTLFDASKSYLQNELVAHSGEIFRAGSAIPAGAFNATLWTKISPTPQAAMGVSPFSATATYAANDLVAYSGKIYAAKAAVPAGAWNVTQWTDISPALTAATATTLGGVKAPARPAGQFVTGVAADGSLTYSAITGGLTYVGPKDLTAAYVAPTTAPNVGSFLMNTGTGALHASWAAVTLNPPATVGPGDTMVWDGAKWHHNVGQLSALPAPTASTLGGVFATARPGAGRFVTGFTATGALNFENILDTTNAWTKAQRGAPVAGSGAFDFAAANNFTIEAAGAAITIANPTNVVAGQSGAIVINNAASVAFGTFFKFDSAKTPTASGAGKKDVLVYYVMDATHIVANLVKGVQ